MTIAEIRINLRAQAFKALAALCFLIGIAAGGAPGRGASLSAYAAADTAWQFLGILAAAWMAMAAVRETSLRTAPLIYSKPQPTERLVLTRFIGALAPVLGMVAALFLGAAAARLLSGGSFTGFAVYFYQFLRASGPIFFVSSLAFAMGILFDSVLAGSIAGLLWIVLLAGRSYLPKVFFPAYTQNIYYFVLFAVALVLIAAAVHRRSRRGAAPTPAWIAVASPILIVVALAGLWRNAVSTHDPQIYVNPVLARIAGQHAETGLRAPGFTLPDQSGRMTSLSHFPGRIILLALISPQSIESAVVLQQLQQLQDKYGARGVQALAVCISQDQSAGSMIARGDQLSFPVVTDIGTYHGPAGFEQSPVAEAYEAAILPQVSIIDRRRRLRQTYHELVASEGSALEAALIDQLEREPR